MKTYFPILVILVFSNFILGQTTLHNCQYTLVLQGASYTQDTQVLSSRPNNNFNYSVSNTAYSWTDNGVNASKYALIKFSIPRDLGSICEAKLSLYYNPTDPYETFDYHVGPDNGFVINRITSNWGAPIVTWNTRPSITSVNQVILPPPTSNTQNYLDINVKSMVIDMLSNGQIYGFQLSMVNPNPYRSVLFASSTNPNPNLHPKLVIKHTGTINLIVSPNPAISSISVDYSAIKLSNNAMLSIYSENGEVFKEVLPSSSYPNSQSSTIDVSKLKPGVYYVKIVDNAEVIGTTKFIKK